MSILDLTGNTIEPGPLLVGLMVSALSGYAAIALLLRVLARVGFMPFAAYAAAVGVLGLILL